MVVHRCKEAVIDGVHYAVPRAFARDGNRTLVLLDGFMLVWKEGVESLVELPAWSAQATAEDAIAVAEANTWPLFTALFRGSEHTGILVAAPDSQEAMAWTRSHAHEHGLSGAIKPYRLN